jgi:hypothetical protein
MDDDGRASVVNGRLRAFTAISDNDQWTMRRSNGEIKGCC